MEPEPEATWAEDNPQYDPTLAVDLLASIRHLCVAILVVLAVGTVTMGATWNALLVNREHIDRVTDRVETNTLDAKTAVEANTEQVRIIVDNIAVFNANHAKTQRLICTLIADLGYPVPEEC